MGFNFIGSKSNGDRVEYTPSFSITNFTVKDTLECQTKDGTHYCMLWINYPDAKNYNGDKILVYKNKLTQILSITALDPHFLEDGISPIARFEPTIRGWVWGKKFLAKLLT
jgi:hypothetical protein